MPAEAGFRRLKAVMQVVETLGPSEGRHHARRIRNAGMRHWLHDERFRTVASWGNPPTWPGLLLGTPRAFAPTSLRYLSQALWLVQRGLVRSGSSLVEIGVGYGGLAAINAVVSEARTLLVDLPDVEHAAANALNELGLAESARTSTPHAKDDGGSFDCFVSNYAFTELRSDLQQQFIQNYAVRSRHGMIVSNANVFASRIGGMDNEAILSALRRHGIEASLSGADDVLSPMDRAFGTVLIAW